MLPRGGGMRVLPLLVAMWVGLAGCTRAGDTRHDGEDGVGGQRFELCGRNVTCLDGVLHSVFGVNCRYITGACSLGCRVSSAIGSPQDEQDPDAFARTLCVQPDASTDTVEPVRG